MTLSGQKNLSLSILKNSKICFTLELKILRHLQMTFIPNECQKKRNYIKSVKDIPLNEELISNPQRKLKKKKNYR